MCAYYHCDKHVVKMITEHSQMLSTAVRSTGIDAGYKETHINHPCTKWVRESIDNWIWLWKLNDYLHDEWRYRYGHPKNKNHKAWEVMKALPFPADLPNIGLTPFVQAMPDEYKNEDAVVAYRNYYKNEKKGFATWKNRAEPFWMK